MNYARNIKKFLPVFNRICKKYKNANIIGYCCPVTGNYEVIINRPYDSEALTASSGPEPEDPIIFNFWPIKPNRPTRMLSSKSLYKLEIMTKNKDFHGITFRLNNGPPKALKDFIYWMPKTNDITLDVEVDIPNDVPGYNL
jgi:hypothetical protein